jgi:beta-N-acetylhexosaminidase
MCECVTKRVTKYIHIDTPPEPCSDAPFDQAKQAELARALHKRFGERLIVVALREPYDIRRFPEVDNYLCTFGYRPCSLRAVADALFGLFTPQGKAPVDLP